MDLSPLILSSINKEAARVITVAPLMETRATATETTMEAAVAKITAETTTVTTVVAEAGTSATTAIEITMIVVVLTTREGSLSSGQTISETEAE